MVHSHDTAATGSVVHACPGVLSRYRVGRRGVVGLHPPAPAFAAPALCRGRVPNLCSAAPEGRTRRAAFQAAVELNSPEPLVHGEEVERLDELLPRCRPRVALLVVPHASLNQRFGETTGHRPPADAPLSPRDIQGLREGRPRRLHPDVVVHQRAEELGRLRCVAARTQLLCDMLELTRPQLLASAPRPGLLSERVNRLR